MVSDSVTATAWKVHQDSMLIGLGYACDIDGPKDVDTELEELWDYVAARIGLSWRETNIPS